MDGNTVYFGSNKVIPWWRKMVSRQRAKFAVTAIAVVVVIVGLVVYQKQHDASVRTAQITKQKEAILNAAINTAEADRNANEYSQSYNVLRPVENDAVTTQDKVRYYNLMYLVAQTVGRIAESLTYLQKKHQADPSTTKPDAYVMARDYQDLGDNAQALAQYKIALQYEESLPVDQQYADRITEIKQAIQLLGGQS